MDASSTYRECGNYIILSNPATATSTAGGGEFWTVSVAEIKYANFSFNVAVNDVDVKILGSIDGTTFPVTILASHTMVVGSATHVESFTNTGLRALRFEVQDTVPGNRGSVDCYAILRSA
jgi:hypothetical protein